ncbi:MAG: CHAD domain-containing protein [Verrucomicrobiaceae bacterium]|nr:CHAD domain-containing protein [Verrucomicrobiaceae bacterium]
MKKLRSVLLLAGDRVPAAAMTELKRHIRRLKRSFGSRRDLDATASLAADIGGVTLVRSLGRPPRNRNAPQLSGHRRDLRCLMVLLEQLPCGDVTCDDVARSFARACRKAVKAWRLAAASPDARNLHEWRKRLKTVCFQLLFLHPHGARMRRMFDVADRSGHWLGQINDLEMLSRCLSGKRTTVDKRARSRINHRKAELTRKALRAGRALDRKEATAGMRKLVRRRLRSL